MVHCHQGSQQAERRSFILGSVLRVIVPRGVLILKGNKSLIILFYDASIALSRSIKSVLITKLPNLRLFVIRVCFCVKTGILAFFIVCTVPFSLAIYIVVVMTRIGIQPKSLSFIYGVLSFIWELPFPPS